MTSADPLLGSAEAALTAARDGNPDDRVKAMTQFMSVMEALAHEVSNGTFSWDELRPWAVRNADRLRAARDAVSDWEVELGSMFNHGGEEEKEQALTWRSQHAFARELFRGTPGDELLAGFEDAEMDADYRAASERIPLDGEVWYPASHTWWRTSSS
jgi:hypothetical protein